MGNFNASLSQARRKRNYPWVIDINPKDGNCLDPRYKSWGERMAAHLTRNGMECRFEATKESLVLAFRTEAMMLCAQKLHEILRKDDEDGDQEE